MKDRVVVFRNTIISIILTIMVLELPIKYGLNVIVDISALFVQLESTLLVSVLWQTFSFRLHMHLIM